MNMAEIPYITFEKELLKIRAIVCVTSSVRLEMTGNLKILYRYMLDRYLFFYSLGNAFYDNQDDLADSLGMTKRTIVTLIKNLVDVGLIEKRTSRFAGANNSNAYIVYDIFDKTKFNTAAAIKSCVPKVVKKAPHKKVIVQDDFDDEPF